MKTLENNGQATATKANETNSRPAYNEDVVTHVKMYADNVRDIWDKQDDTARQLAKKMRRGLTPDPEYLANSESVRRIAAEAKKAAALDTWCRPTPADMDEIRRRIAAYIIEELATWKVNHPEDEESK